MDQKEETPANILIVDDIADNLKVLGDLLRAEGYKVRPVPNGKLALQVAEKETPDLILLDIMMPEMNGFEVCKLLKANDRLKDVPIIFISALNDTKDIVNALTFGGADYITKPFMTEEVKARVATHLKIAQQKKELQKLNADKDRFITILAHDLRSPFSGIISFAELLATNVRLYDVDKIERLSNIIYKSSQHFQTLLEDLLIWARVQAGHLPFNPETILIRNLCDDVVNVLVVNADNKDIIIHVDISNELTVFADKNMIQTILRNLVSNAIKFTSNYGRILIRVEKTQSDVIISVTDTGVGMSPESVAKLFDITKIQSTKGTNDESGTGFGLLLCKEFVDKHDGRIWVESEEGRGTTFYFSLKEK